MVLELERAERVGDPFEGVGHRVRVVVHRVHLPLVARHRVDGVALDPVDWRVAEVEVWRRHVDLEAEEGKEASEELRRIAQNCAEIAYQDGSSLEANRPAQIALQPGVGWGP